MASWFNEEIVENDRLALLLCFVSFIVTFITTRVITRMIRAGRGPFKNNVSTGGLHVHHAVPGVILLVIGAFLSVGTGSEVPWAEIAAVLIGIGTSLVLDEFALILHLQDVYWSDEGRISVEMVSLAVACLGLALVGISPADFSGDPEDNAAIGATITGIVIHLLLIVVCVTKGKYKWALFGAFIPVASLIGAVRIARPTSRWAKRRYGPEKMAKAQQRAAWFDARFGPLFDWISDFIAGKPSEPDAKPTPS